MMPSRDKDRTANVKLFRGNHSEINWGPLVPSRGAFVRRGRRLIKIYKSNTNPT